MELYGQSTAGGLGSGAADNGPGRVVFGTAESIRKLGLWGTEGYPERMGVSDCAHYMRTGFCGFGATCRFTHPRGFGSVGLPEMRRWLYPERPGEPTCQYYLRTGICKFGAYCKFHHPKIVGGSLSNVPLNLYGFPFRPGEKECFYYLRTGQCKFGITCIFHHPQQAGISGQATAYPFHPTVQSLPGLSLEQYSVAPPSFRDAKHPFLPGPYLPSAYGPVFLNSGVVPVPNWTHSGPLSPAFVGPYSPLHATTGLQCCPQHIKCFPERPGQPECKYYMKTGCCKFGSLCKFHHPPDCVPYNLNCAFSPLGLPLHQGVEPCSFYLRNGFCKFGGNCKFDHPMEILPYSPSASSLTNAPYMLGPSSTTSLADLQPGFIRKSIVGPSFPKARIPSSASAVLKHSQTAPTSHSNMKRSNC